MNKFIRYAAISCAVIFILFGFLIFTGSSGTVKNYAVNREESGITCPVYYPQKRAGNPTYEFETVLFYPEDCGKLGNEPYYRKFHIYISHLYRPTCIDCGLEIYPFMTTLRVENEPGDKRTEFPIVPGSVKITHYTDNEQTPILPAKTEGFEENEKVSPGWQTVFYHQFYLPQEFPETLYERVQFEMVYKGKRIKFDKTFKLHQKDHYDAWDALGSV